MSAVNNLLDMYRETCSIASDSAMADALHVTRQGVHQWRKGLAWPSEDHIIAMAKAIGESPSTWLPLIAADRAKNPEARQVWLRLAKTAAAIAVTLSFGRLDVQAETAYHASLTAGQSSSVDIMRN